MRTATQGLGDASSALAGGAISGGVQLATAAASLWLNSIQLSHTADTATTQIVNGLAPKLQAIVDAYNAGPGTCADQAAAMAAYLSAVTWLMSPQGCGNGAYGSAGNACISDRFGPGGPTDTNAKYPWAAYYYWPIANDPRASGCAAALAVSNPNAALQSAITNVSDVISGSDQQTTAGLYAPAASTGTTVADGSTAASPVVSSGSILSDTLLGIPIWGWGAGLLVAFLVFK